MFMYTSFERSSRQQNNSLHSRYENSNGTKYYSGPYKVASKVTQPSVIVRLCLSKALIDTLCANEFIKQYIRTSHCH